MSGSIRVVFEAKYAADLIAWAKNLLEEQGYVVGLPSPLHSKETPTQFCARIGLHVGTFSRKVRLPECPTNFECQRSPGGRIAWLRASRELDEFMTPPSSRSESSA
jgi:hypothetical protein